MMSMGHQFQQHHHLMNSPNIVVNPSTDQQSQYSTYPHDFGLPTNLNVSTLVRRSPSYQLNPNCGSMSHHGVSSQQLPASYDLAKYPKEYINPNHPTYMSYGPPPPGTVIYTTHDPASSAQQGGHHHNNHQQPSYPYTIIPPPGTYVYHSGPGPDDYVMSMGMEMPLSITMDHMGGTYVEIPSSSAQISCSCAPILEANEEVDGQPGVDVNSVSVSVLSGSRDKSTSTTNSHLPQPPKRLSSSSSSLSQPSQISSGKNHSTSSTTMNSNVNHVVPISSTSPSTSSSSTSKSSSSTSATATSVVGGGGSNGKSNDTVKSRLQRQFTTQINESPDEGYEDESAEGTEI
jgi:hypothetical protein